MIDPAITELDNEAFPSMTPEVTQLKKDTLLAPAVKDKAVSLADNFAELRMPPTRTPNRNGPPWCIRQVT
jgi:hypothetical protein